MKHLTSLFDIRKLTRSGLAIRGVLVAGILVVQRLLLDPTSEGGVSWSGIVVTLVLFAAFGGAWVRKNEADRAETR